MTPKSRMTRPRITLPSPAAVTLRPSAFTPLPSSTTTGRLPLVAKSGSEVASMMIWRFSVGSAPAVMAMVCAPPTSASGMLKKM